MEAKNTVSHNCCPLNSKRENLQPIEAGDQVTGGLLLNAVSFCTLAPNPHLTNMELDPF